ncbi:hypothetical protein L1279_001106 [Planomicrobium sp. HSC-17F08]|nr:hypothetical protein [Planomicrobium sp. HSC-17F08]
MHKKDTGIFVHVCHNQMDGAVVLCVLSSNH